MSFDFSLDVIKLIVNFCSTYLNLNMISNLLHIYFISLSTNPRDFKSTGKKTKIIK